MPIPFSTTFGTLPPSKVFDRRGLSVKDGYMQAGSVPVAITDYALTSLIWIKRPIKPPTLPQKYVIAQCYATVEPDAKLWKNYTSIISKLKDKKTISSDDYYLLRYSQVAHAQMMDMPFGDEDAMTEGTTLEILDRIKCEIRKKDLSLLAEERKRHTEKEQESLQKIDEVTKQKEEAIKKSILDKELHDRKIAKLEINLEKKARKIAQYTSWCVFTLGMIVITGGAIYSFLSFITGILKYVLLVAAIIFVVIAILNLIFGISLRDFVKRLEVNIASWLQNVLKKWFLPLE